MFAEDVGLLPKKGFADFIGQCHPADFDETTKAVDDRRLEASLREIWGLMGDKHAKSRYSLTLNADLKCFNGGLFADPNFFQLGLRAARELHHAASQNWANVEPAIFGTLLEQALSATERAKLGAHYTPRPYVERLVCATIMDVLEADWAAVDVVGEAKLDSDTPEIRTESALGRINADLTVGADVTGATELQANAGLSCNGTMLAGQGFKLEAGDAAEAFAAGDLMTVQGQATADVTIAGVRIKIVGTI